MDPLSIAAGVAGLATLAVQVSSGFQKLRETCKDLPARVHALSNEVNDFRMVLCDLETMVKERRRFTTDDLTAVSALIGNSHEKLREIHKLVEGLQTLCTTKHDYHPSRVLKWQKLHPRLQRLQEDVRSTRSSLITLLGTSNSRDMLRVRLDLQDLTTETRRSSVGLIDILESQEEKVTGSIDQGFDLVDDRIASVEDTMQLQLAQMEEKFTRQMGLMYGLGKSHTRQRQRSRSPGSDASSTRSMSSSRASSVRVRVTKQITSACYAGCSCACHFTQRQTTGSGIFTKFIGKLFVGYAGLPYMTAACDADECERRQDASLSAEYWFPVGFCWSQIVKVQMAYDPNLGPSFSLATFRQVPDDAPAVAFALEGNVNELKNLFTRGLASPRDISATRGYSLLRWALYGQKYETCKFLIQQGADPHYKPISASDDAPSDKAGDIVLRGGLPARTIEILRAIAETSDFVERQNFHAIHKVVLGLSFAELETIILSSQEDIDVPDATGRTALEWAAARGDDRAVTTLLSYGADPNSMDLKLNTPLTLAANQNHAVCVRLLLEAGAEPDPDLPRGIKFGTPLNCAARNATDPLILKTLIDFGANLEATGVDGVTPLLHVARKQGARHAMLLLDAGANINAAARDGRTPLTTAIIYNNHHVLQLLLDRWYEYSECPRLKGPHLLDLIVKHADGETVRIIARTSHLKVSGDDSYVMDHFKEQILQRSEVDKGLETAFDELMKAMRQAPTSSSGRDVGCLSATINSLCGRRDEESLGVCVGHDSSGSDTDTAYEDAMEAWEPVSKEFDSSLGSGLRTQTW